MNFELRYDLRNPARWRRPWSELYEQCLEQVSWADRNGFRRVYLSEHHFSDDGFLPAPLILAAAIAARTERIRIRVNLVILPLKHPVKLAEEAALVDIISGGRLELVFGAGYRRTEFEAYGLAIEERASRMEESIEIVRRCWEEEEFDYEGRHWQLRGVRAMPKPVQRPRPRIILGATSPAGARRAARIADGLSTAIPEIREVWRIEMHKLGKGAGAPPAVTPDPVPAGHFLHLARDPEAAWKVIGPHALYESNAHVAWDEERGQTTYRRAEHADELLAGGLYRVLTPADAIALARRLDESRPRSGRLIFHPMMAGIPFELGQQSLELAATEVMPAFSPGGPS